MTDASGNVVWKQDYYAFGSDYGAVASGNTHKFTGHTQDAATGQYYAKARYFTTQLGRWSQPEPLLKSIPPKRFLLNPQELNPYVYCANNPTRFVDPDGKFMLIVEYNRSAQYGSKALVWNGLLPDGIYNMKTRADIKGTNAAAKSGVYDYKLGQHEGSYFPKHDALIINNNKAVPTEAPNPNQGGKSIATGIHSHAGNPETANNQGKTGSAGCWTVPAVQSSDAGKYDRKDQSTWNYYNDYISNFEDDPSGKAVLIRPAEIIDDIKDAFKKDETK